MTGKEKMVTMSRRCWREVTSGNAVLRYILVVMIAAASTLTDYESWVSGMLCKQGSVCAAKMVVCALQRRGAIIGSSTQRIKGLLAGIAGVVICDEGSTGGAVED
ncbi:hypothetical protein MKX03_008250 [Papaver bracteatum]|nr:hypothetical protein MKX03_008250 [Papaver bracteatum]